MKNYLKIVSWPLRIMILLAVLALGFYGYFSREGSEPLQKKEAVTVQETKTEEGKSEITIQDASSAEIEKEFPVNMKENELMSAIHKMSHQKVTAEKKWGAIPLTPERVKRLLAVVNENQTKYKNAELYLDILNRWAEGDFSEAVADHNDIWALQGGTVGEATGIASTAEEKDFIEKNFTVKQ